MFKQMEIAEQVYKGGKPYKIPIREIPTVTVKSVKVRDYNPPRLPTPKRAALASARQKMQIIQVISHA